MLGSLKIHLSLQLLLVFAAAASHAQVIYAFGRTPNDGLYPAGGVLMSAEGSLFGTTYGGGSNDGSATNSGGTVYLLTPPAGHGGWTEQLIHEFPASSVDGENPQGDLVADASGALYGTTTYCCSIQHSSPRSGSVYKLAQPAAGAGAAWTETILYTFKGSDGAQPVTGLVLGGSGELYGTTSLGGAFDKAQSSG